MNLVWLGIATVGHGFCAQQEEQNSPPTRASSSSSFTFCEGSSLNDNEEKGRDKIGDAVAITATDYSDNIPLWPNVSQEDVDDLVEELLKDPSINLSLIPDGIEAQLYRSTVLLVINIVYSALWKLDGLQILAHELQLTRMLQHQDTITNEEYHRRRRAVTAEIISRSKNQVNDDVLEQIADRLLANETINATFVPDVVERELYVNCLKVIFRVLLILSNSFSISICGHDVRIVLEPSTLADIALKESGVIAKSSRTEVDMELLQEFASQAGVKSNDNGPSSWSDRLRFREKLITRLHASLYGLILGIVDDILANTKLKILSDDIDLDMIPATDISNSKKGKKIQSLDHSTDAKSNDENVIIGGKKDSTSGVSVGSFAVASFAAGVGVGVAAMAALATRQ